MHSCRRCNNVQIYRQQLLPRLQNDDYVITRRPCHIHLQIKISDRRGNRYVVMVPWNICSTLWYSVSNAMIDVLMRPRIP